MVRLFRNTLKNCTLDMEREFFPLTFLVDWVEY